MNNFEFYCPTKVVFGKGTIAKLPELIDKLGDEYEKILVDRFVCFGSDLL